ncbi:hypothetical protein WKR88_00170 [Trinickia caryophylli]|uniref:hypothetical protein n=1 Tax=Trinickia caryophylli TaxID=28094 RepID=UPI000A169C86|nr:hypothetical protein [Trinickia caryophylli]PMS13535.1 hypothetical protein C0Z17_04430 [Trinickia caryophylli]TRX13603.1 hypothetical protein FNF07_19535 [Trinickia caryophylli]TRX15804.1 hypothetical protein FNF07_19455 [Trinickia caryophylli]TRX15807.1 hypothetical protein FNF07_19470 [Trinickia caryophylli]WQE15178.1 hypothetical protein U0034_21760 [Trinickia caryophylli]
MDQDALAALETVLDDRAQFEKLLRATWDSRMPAATWRRMLTAELLELKAWSYRKLMACNAAPPKLDNAGRVFSLLPGYGFALHTIRRALPFAFLGVPVTCAFSRDNVGSGARVVAGIAAALGVKEALNAAQTDAATLLGSLPPRRIALAVVTGRRQTVANVSRILGAERVVGCTGRCAIEIRDGRDWEPTASSRMGRSCTIVRASFVKEGSRWRGRHAVWDPLVVVRRLHPSVIVDRTGTLVDTIGGYRCIQPDRGLNLSGFAADPQFGWPGDYLLAL